MKTKNNKKFKKALFVGAGLMALTLTSFTNAQGFGNGNGNGNSGGQGCHGDVACMETRMKTEGFSSDEINKFKAQRLGQNNGVGNGRNSNGRQNFNNDEFQNDDCQQELDSIENGQKYDLSVEEKEYISHMREEEKIARDVYTTLYDKWGIQTFGNIIGSEQRHMDMIKILIDKYDLKDSMSDNTVGKFDSLEFQKLYDDLIAKGLSSEKDALIVAMTIEDLDIYDLDRYLVETKNEDVKEVFTRLNNGSYNHMKAFKRQLDRANETYEVQFITKERMDEVLNYVNNNGNSNGNRNGNSNGNRNMAGNNTFNKRIISQSEYNEVISEIKRQIEELKVKIEMLIKNM